MIDVTIVHHGTVVLLRPETTGAAEWIGNNVATPTWYEQCLVVEARYVPAILQGMRDDGVSFGPESAQSSPWSADYGRMAEVKARHDEMSVRMGHPNRAEPRHPDRSERRTRRDLRGKRVKCVITDADTGEHLFDVIVDGGDDA